jgi:hypothetical protein
MTALHALSARMSLEDPASDPSDDFQFESEYVKSLLKQRTPSPIHHRSSASTNSASLVRDNNMNKENGPVDRWRTPVTMGPSMGRSVLANRDMNSFVRSQSMNDTPGIKQTTPAVMSSSYEPSELSCNSSPFLGPPFSLLCVGNSSNWKTTCAYNPRLDPLPKKRQINPPRSRKTDFKIKFRFPGNPLRNRHPSHRRTQKRNLSPLHNSIYRHQTRLTRPYRPGTQGFEGINSITASAIEFNEFRQCQWTVYPAGKSIYAPSTPILQGPKS